MNEDLDYGSWTLIGVERDRQMQDLGWTTEHDDGHTDGSLAMAAACYAAGSVGNAIYLLDDAFVPDSIRFEEAWPWHEEDDKRSRAENTDERRVISPPSFEKRKRLLVKAGALICAEIDRLDRIMNGTAEDHLVVQHET